MSDELHADGSKLSPEEKKDSWETGIIMATDRRCGIFKKLKRWKRRIICYLAVLALLYFGSRKISKRKMSPILLIVVSAALGVAVYGI